MPPSSPFQFLPSRGRHILVWLNVFVQGLFPLAASFTPAVAATSQEKSVCNMLMTRPYTLAAGETVTSVARKVELSVDALRRLNQFRIFARGFDHLQAGDELDIPVRGSGKASCGEIPQRHDEERGRQVAGIASRTGQFLASRPGSDGMSSTGAGSVHQWIGSV